LNSYARTAMGVENGTGDLMNKIRILYRFSPGFDALLPAYEAARGMNIRVRDLPGRQSGNIFERDRKNFGDLTERLIAKYERRSNALDQLLGHTEPATAIKGQTAR